MSVRVVARIRPLLPRELDKDVIIRADCSEEGRPPNIVKIPSPKNEAEEFSFTFNSVYGQETSQEELFNAEVAPHVRSLFQGLDITLFAYGVTGTGKTHTMRGGLKLADRGAIPRLLSHVFRRGKKTAKESAGATTVSVFLSYYEIYNDKVFDLLEPPEKRTPSGLPLREKDNKTFVVGLSEQACDDLRDFERLYIAANQNRVTAATKLNAHSSRSHAILRVKVVQKTATETGAISIRESTASAIDLAGSEDNRRTDNDRQRLVESAAINKSLFVLSQCVDAMVRGEKRIPYRESKMTRILSLGQNQGITIMILNLAPIRSYHLDTLSSLNVSSRAKRIEVREIENEVVFKQPPRSMSHGLSASSLSGLAPPGSGLVRQPLRALTSNTHNMQTGAAAASKATAADKPVKAFAVYTDRATPKPATVAPSLLPASLTSQSHIPPPSTASRIGLFSQLRRAGAADGGNKRTADGAEPRPSKLARPTIHAHTAASIVRPAAAAVAVPATPAPAAMSAMSAEDIEKIIERKVAEALAARAEEELAEKKHQQLVEEQKGHDEEPSETRKRLDALERRLDESRGEDSQHNEGLRWLLRARQHRAGGDDAAALRCYEEALDFFPGQARLLSKIEKLRARVAARGPGGMPRSHSSGSNDSGGCSPARSVRALRRKSMSARSLRSARSEASESEYPEADADADAEDDLGWRSAKKDKTGSRRRLFVASHAADADADDEAPLTPRKQHLTDTVNSRDVARIRSLAGAGSKKARALVAYLDSELAEERAAEQSGTEDSAPATPTAGCRMQSVRPMRSLAHLRSIPRMDEQGELVV